MEMRDTVRKSEAWDEKVKARQAATAAAAILLREFVEYVEETVCPEPDDPIWETVNIARANYNLDSTP